MPELTEDWEFNVMGVYNYRRPGRLSSYMDFIRQNFDKIEGDLFEAGVFRGNSLIAAALLLRELGSDKMVYGYDSFVGFPQEKHPFDNVSGFDGLLAAESISQEHHDRVQKNLELRRVILNDEPNIESISSSGRFDNTSLELLKRKIDYFGLTNVKIIGGEFGETMSPKRNNPTIVMAGLIDCDLYSGYVDTLNFFWPRLSSQGMIFLDEYFSLKFPGARVAVDDFVLDNHADARLARSDEIDDGFERWFLLKK